MPNYFVGTQETFDALPLLPEIGTMNGGIRLNSNIAMGIGSSVIYEGVRFSELTYSATRHFHLRLATDSVGSQMSLLADQSSVFISNGVASPTSISTGAYVGYSFSETANANIGNFFCYHTGSTQFGRCRSRSIVVKDPSGNTVWSWLTQVGDYKSDPPGGTVVGTLTWHKRGIEANYLTPSAFASAVTTPTEPVTVIVMTAGDGVGIPATINRQPVRVVVWGTGAETWLSGSVASYYKYPGVPYLKFDGVDDRAVIPIVINGDFTATISFTPLSGQTGPRYILKASNDFVSGVYLFYDGADGKVRFQTGDGATLGGITAVASLVWGAINTITVAITGVKISLTLNGVTSTGLRSATVFSPAQITVCGRTSDNSVSAKVYLATLTVNGISYLNPGDQNAGGLLPSNPSGANGTLIGGVSWMYNNIARHDETAALTLAAINATTLTGPLLVIDLDGSIPAGYLPASKDGWAINMIRHMTNKQNLTSISLSLGLI